MRIIAAVSDGTKETMSTQLETRIGHGGPIARVGPVTTATLLSNVVALARLHKGNTRSYA